MDKRWATEWESMAGTLMAWPLDWCNVQSAFSSLVDELQDVGMVYALQY
jgi:hypothetical protein